MDKELTTPDDRFLALLAAKMDALLSYINQEYRLMNCSQGIELSAFSYLLDNMLIPSHDTETLAVSYKRESVEGIVQELHELWEAYHYWLYEGELIPLADWKMIYNKAAELYGMPLLLL